MSQSETIASSFGPSPILWSSSVDGDFSHEQLVIFDRDNTLIADCGRSNRIEEFLWLEGAVDALKLIVNSGYRIAIATNQAGLERGLFTREQLDIFHRNLDDVFFLETQAHLAVIAICPHMPEKGCDCRKPRPGLLQAIAQNKHGNPSVMFGDSRTDIEAATSFGIAGIQVHAGHLLDAVKDWLSLQ